MVATRDYYNVLGVPRNATNDQLKKSYRTLALRYHPDRNPGNLAAEQRFKDITEADAVLSDPEERARYDRLGPLYRSGGAPPTPDDLSEVFGRVWDNLWNRSKPTPGGDLRYTLSITLEEVGTGLSREIQVPREVQCSSCQGEGALPQHLEVCTHCDGTGRSKGPRLLRTQCYHCKGRGQVITTPCTTCQGAGLKGRMDALRVKVPAGVATGQKLKLSGKGNESGNGGPTGDLYVLIHVEEHPLFRRRGADLLVDLPLSAPLAVLGTDLDVPTLDGSTVIRVPPRTPHGRVFRLAGRGLPRVGGGGRGALLLDVQLELPEDLSSKDAAALAAWAASLRPQQFPKHLAFQQAVEKRR